MGQGSQGGTWSGQTRARVRLGHEEVGNPDKWGPPVGDREREGRGGVLGWAGGKNEPSGPG